MRRTDVLHGIRPMRFEEIYGRTRCPALSPAEAASVPGVSARRAPVDTVIEVLDRFDNRSFDFTALWR